MFESMTLTPALPLRERDLTAMTLRKLVCGDNSKFLLPEGEG
jgi:hypothetical protein